MELCVPRHPRHPVIILPVIISPGSGRDAGGCVFLPEHAVCGNRVPVTRCRSGAAMLWHYMAEWRG